MERSEKPDTKKPVIDRLFGMPKTSCILYKIHLKTNLPDQGRHLGGQHQQQEQHLRGLQRAQDS